ncbi:MAG: porin family protein [Pseudomonadota bacterium]
MRTLSKIVTLILTSLLCANAAHAQYYGGMALGNDRNRAHFGFNGGDAPSELVLLTNMVTNTAGLSLSPEPSIGIKLGYHFTPYFSVEGRFADRATNTNIFSGDVAFNTAREKSLGLDLVGTVPLIKKMSLLGRAGFRNESFAPILGDSAITAGTSLPPNLRGLNSGVVGIGLQYNFNMSLGLRFEVERTRKFFGDRGNLDADNVSFGVFWRF